MANPGANSGKAEPAPMFPSPKGANQQVGIDPEFVFAWPKGSGLEKSPEPAPLRATTIEVSLDGGKTWKHPSSTAALQVRLVDKPYTDNYGRVRIFVLPGA